MDTGLSLQATDFALFGLPERFAIDLAQLDAKWKQLQGAAHPDRFATETAAAQRVAMQWAIRINEAWRRLKDPLARAAYLCSLHGADIEAESNTSMPGAFLMQQMEWREALSEATTLAAVDALSDEVVTARNVTLQSLQAQLALPDGARIAAANLVHAGLPLVEAIVRHWDEWQHGVPALAAP